MSRKILSGHESLILFLVFLALNLEVKGDISLVTLGKETFIKTGQNLRINCTVFSREFKPNLVLKWKKVGSPLTIKSLRISNNTLQLQIHNISRSDGGQYECVVMRQARVVNSTSAHVIVADFPSQPSISTWRSINWHICFNWNPVSSTGGLAVTYKIRYRCLSQCELDGDENLLSNGWHEVCKNTLPTPGQEMRCCLDHVTVFIQYEAVVIAENVLGSVTSAPVKFSRGIKTTVGPPQSLRAQVTGYGAITIDWIPPPDSSYWKIKYVILYHAQRDTSNKTITLGSNGQNHHRLTGLKPYTNYTLYVAGIGPIDSGVGFPVGPVVVLTKEENPSDAPEITSWSSTVSPENPNRRNVTINWKLPPKDKWNGRLRKFIVQYRKISNKGMYIVSKNPWGETVSINCSSRNKGIISNLHTTSAYQVEMQMCNGAGCGGIGNKITITGLEQHELGDRRDVYDGVLVLLLIFTIIVLLLFAMTILVCFKIKSRMKQPADTETSSKCYPMKGKGYDRMEGGIPA